MVKVVTRARVAGPSNCRIVGSIRAEVEIGGTIQGLSQALSSGAVIAAVIAAVVAVEKTPSRQVVNRGNWAA